MAVLYKIKFIMKVSLFSSLLSDGEPIKLPDNLESLPRADHFPTQRHRWNTNEVSRKWQARNNSFLSLFVAISILLKMKRKEKHKKTTATA